MPRSKGLSPRSSRLRLLLRLADYHHAGRRQLLRRGVDREYLLGELQHLIGAAGAIRPLCQPKSVAVVANGDESVVIAAMIDDEDIVAEIRRGGSARRP